MISFLLCLAILIVGMKRLIVMIPNKSMKLLMS